MLSCAVYLLSPTFSRSLAVMVLSACKDIRWCAKTGTYCSADSSIKRFTSCRSKPSSCKTQGKLPDFALKKKQRDRQQQGWQQERAACSFLPSALLEAFHIPKDTKARKPNSQRSSGPRHFTSTIQSAVFWEE